MHINRTFRIRVRSIYEAIRRTLVINFGHATLKEGINRVVNELASSVSPRLRVNQLNPNGSP